MGAGCTFTQVTTEETARTPTSTTNGDCTPAMGAGYGCSNGMDRAANCRDRQKPIDVKPQQSPKNEKLQSAWMNPYELCGPGGQSAWHPQGFVAGNGCSAKGDRATDRRDGPPQVEARYRPRQDEPQNTGGIGGWGHYGPTRQSAMLPHSHATPARLEPTPPEPQAPENPLPQQRPPAHGAPNRDASAEESATKKRHKERANEYTPGIRSAGR